MNEEETRVEAPVPERFGLTDEERDWVIAQVKEARRTQPVYAARMRAFGRHTQETMRRRFTV